MAYQCLDTAIRTLHFVRVVRDKRDVTVSAVVINLLWLTIIQLPKIVVMDGGSGWMVTRVLLGYLQYLDEVAVSKDDFWFMHSTFARRALLGTFTRDTKSVDRIRVIKRRHTKQPVGIYVCFASLASIHPALTHTFSPRSLRNEDFSSTNMFPTFLSLQKRATSNRFYRNRDGGHWNHKNIWPYSHFDTDLRRAKILIWIIYEGEEQEGIAEKRIARTNKY